MKRIGQSARHSFVKVTLGFTPPTNVSLNDLVVQGLAHIGIEKPVDMSAKRFIEANAGKVLGVATVKRRRLEKAVGGDGFLSSYEWRKVRMEALKKWGAKCQCCGASAKTGAVINVDHIKPRKVFPELALDLNNLQVLCHDCNHGKGNWDMTDWREPME